MNFKKSPFKHITELAVFFFALVLVYVLQMNTSLFWSINSVSEFTGTFLWANLTILGDALVAAVVFFLFIKRKPQLVWTALVAAVIATAIVHTCKPLFDVARPAAVLDNDVINIIGPAHHRRAFPSGHTATIFTLTGVLVMFTQKRWQQGLLYLLALFVGISRIAVGVHWPADVLAGAAVGHLSAVLGYWIVKRCDWGNNKTAQLIWGGIFAVAALVLLISHDTHYDQAVWLQRIIAAIVLIWGGWEYVDWIRKNN